MSSQLLTLLRRNSGFSASDVTDVPEAEAQALIDLYNATDGPNWTNNSGWLSDPVVNNWDGITVSGGHVTQIDLNANGATMSGSVASWGDDLDTALPNLEQLDLNGTSISGDISGWKFSASTVMIVCFLYDTSVEGDLSGWDVSQLNYISLANTSISGDLSGWSVRSSMRYLYLDETLITAAPPVPASARVIQYQDCSLSQAAVDAIVSGIYTNRASFTYGTPSINIGGSGGTINAAPSGTYQDGDPPTTGKEYIYEICNDPETEGFNTWSVTYNGGSAP